MCPSGATCLPVPCCFNELTLKIIGVLVQYKVDIMPLKCNVLFMLQLKICSLVIPNNDSLTQSENCEYRNDPDLVQAFLKKWWVESDFKAPNLPLSLQIICRNEGRDGSNRSTTFDATEKVCRVGQRRNIQFFVAATMYILIFEIYKRGLQRGRSVALSKASLTMVHGHAFCIIS